MPVFWITINQADLQCSLVICLISVELELLSKIQFVFWQKTTIMNSVALAKFFQILYSCLYLMRAKQKEDF